MATVAANLTRNSIDNDEVATLAVIGFIGSVVVSCVRDPKLRMLTGLCVISLLWFATAWDGSHFDQPDVAMSVIPWTLATGTYLAFRCQSYNLLKNFPKEMGKFFRTLYQSITKVFVGPDTWEKIR
ncbi:hypothetical protein [Streptomyces sp. NPDC059468]|uniref:hypothetical protein n=1 Tax=Streptomyces sp. NPDC059468 TaxID=3346845 RepID=UPI0036C494E9